MSSTNTSTYVPTIGNYESVACSASAITLVVMALIELAPKWESPYTRRTLFPYLLSCLFVCIFFCGYIYTDLRRLTASGVLQWLAFSSQVIYIILDTKLYLERVGAFFATSRSARLAQYTFLVIKAIVRIALGLAAAIIATTTPLEQIAFVTQNRWILACDYALGSFTGLTAIFIDLPLLLAILRMSRLRQSGRKVDPRRIIRLVLLIVFSIACVIMAGSGDSDTMNVTITSWTTAAGLGCYVAIDLYILDMELLKKQAPSAITPAQQTTGKQPSPLKSVSESRPTNIFKTTATLESGQT